MKIQKLKTSRGGSGVSINKQNTRCLIGGSYSTYLYAYDTTTTPWSKISLPSFVPKTTPSYISFNNNGTQCVIVGGYPSSTTIYDFVYDTPLAFKSSNLISSNNINAKFGYVTEDIISGNVGNAKIIFN